MQSPPAAPTVQHSPAEDGPAEVEPATAATQPYSRPTQLSTYPHASATGGTVNLAEEVLLRQHVILARFGELALRSNELGEILTEACRLVGEALGTDLAMVVELQADGKTLDVRAGVGWNPGVVGVATLSISEDSLEGLAFRTGEPMITPDILVETRFKYAPFLPNNGVRAFANVLIIGSKERRPFGLLQVGSRQPREFTDNDIIFLRCYANLVAAAVDRLRVLEDLRNSEALLRHSQKLEVIGRLAAGVAHDFNNILQIISSGIEVLLDDMPAGTPAHDLGKIVLTASTRGAYLTHHLLSYARKQILQPDVIELSDFLAELKKVLSRTLRSHIVINIIVDDSKPCVFVDPGQLQTALLNLAINGSHAMPEGGTLTLRASCEIENGQNFSAIAVTDTGFGMTEATKAQAFEPFFTTKGLGGSGLGLSMVQGFADQSGGDVRIESELGEGTTVELRLPAAMAPRSPQAHRQPLSPLTGSGRILLVDDSADVLATIAMFLEKAGFEVIKAENADQALAIMATDRPIDALVTDYAMPSMNGVELIRHVHALRPGLAALVITGFADVAEYSTSNTFSVLSKPFNRKQLIETLQASMSK